MVCNQSRAECLRSRLRFRAVKRAYFTLTCNAMHAHPAECLRSQLRFRTVKRAYFTLTCNAMHAHPVRRRMGTGFLRPPIRFSTSADTPLTVRFTAITSKLTSSFFYKAFPHLIYGLLRVNKVTVCNQSGAQRATTRIDRGGTPPRIGTGSLPAVGMMLIF